MNVQRVRVNIIPSGIIPVANLSQGDYGREIMFEVFDGNSPADLSEIQTAFLSGEKPDGKAFSLNGTITNNCVSVTSSYQSTALSGNIEAKLVLIDSDSQLKSALIIWDVDADPSSGSVTSDEDIQDIISAALDIKDEAEQNAYNAGQSALAAATSASEASDSETNAATSESNAEAWAVGERGGVPVESTDDTYHNNSKYYSEYAQSIADRLPEGFNPKGTITFSQLPSIADSFVGDTWNISDAFVTTSDFRQGAGISVDADSFVYLTLDHQWDVLSVKLGGVQGVKGNEETTYRTGNVNLTPANIGALATDGDSKNNTVTFTSSDDDATTEKTSDGFTSVATMASGETHASLFQKISKMFLNIRKLWNTVGSTALESGKTITGLLGSTTLDTAYGATLTAQVKNLTDGNTYSTSETWTGKYWIDGKKIYSRMLIGLSVSATSGSGFIFTATNSVPSNLDTLVNFRCRISKESIVYPMITTVNNTEHRFEFTWNSQLSRTISSIYFEYTKTT